MTLIMSLANKDQVIILGDRRISANRKALDDDYNKMAIVKCKEGRFAVGFTGIASFRKFNTSDWLYQSIYDLFRPDYSLVNTLNRLQVKATQDFQTMTELRLLSKEAKRLSVLFSGYVYTYPPSMFLSILTNFDDVINKCWFHKAQDTFEAFSFREPENNNDNFTNFHMIGNINAIFDSEIEILGQMLKDLKPRDAIINKAVEIVRQAADRPSSQNSIGKHFSVVVIPKEKKEPITVKYFSNNVKLEIHTPKAIWAFSEDSHVIAPSIIIANEPGTPVEDLFSVPQVAKNQPCPCGSGKRYKSCHGNKKLHTWTVTIP